MPRSGGVFISHVACHVDLGITIHLNQFGMIWMTRKALFKHGRHHSRGLRVERFDLSRNVSQLLVKHLGERHQGPYAPSTHLLVSSIFLSLAEKELSANPVNRKEAVTQLEAMQSVDDSG